MVITIRFKKCLLVPIALFALVFNACGDKDDSDSSKSSETKSANILKLQELQRQAIAEGNYREALDLGIEIVSRTDEAGVREVLPENRGKEIASIKKRRGLMKKMLEEPDRSPVKLSKQCQESTYCQKVSKARDMLAGETQNLSPRTPDYLHWHQIIELNHRNLQLNALNSKKDTRDLLRAYTNLLGVLDEVSMMMDLSGECPKSMNAKCNELERKIPALRHQRDKHYTEGDLAEFNRLSVELSLATELLKLYRQGLRDDDPKVKDTISRHQTLTDVVDGRRPAYNHLEKQEVEKVMSKFGNLFIQENEAEEVEIKNHLPWAAYWYPFRSRDSYIGDNAPLKRFDDLLKKAGRAPGAVVWEKSRQDGQSWESSDGLCDAWAVAASLTKEPTRSVHYEGMTFSPTTIKGLLIQKYANFEKIRYGIPYKGFISTDGLAQDLRPEAFHKLVTEMLANGEVPIVDTDPNFPIWNMPLYKYSWIVVKDPNFDNAYIVTANAWYVKFRTTLSPSQTNYFGRNSDIYQSIYKYRLFVNPSEQNNQGQRVLYGEWILDDTASAYPDTVFQVNPETAPTPRNGVVAKNLDILDELLQRVE